MDAEKKPDGLVGRVPAHERRRTYTWKDRRNRLVFGDTKPPMPSFRGLIEDPPEDGRTKIGICCSGGGIRSAAYNLGALQVLQDKGVLQDAKYLAAVSGGAYIAGGLAMVAKTADLEEEGPEGSGPPDDSDEKLVTEQRPPFHRGSPEEQYVRNRSSYLAPAGAGRVRLVARIAFGLLVNLLLIGSAIVLAAVLLGAWYHGLHDGLVGSGKDNYSADAPSWSVVVLVALAVPGLLLGITAALLRTKWERLRQGSETLSLWLLLGAAVWGAIEFVIPAALAAIRDGGFNDQRVAFSTTFGSFSALLVAVLAEVRGFVAAPKQVSEDAGRVTKAVRSLPGRARLALAYVLATVAGPLLLIAGLVATLLVLVGNDPWGSPWPALILIPAGVLVFQIAAVRDLTSWSLHPFYRRRLCTAFALKRVPVEGGQEGGEAVERGFDKLVPLSESGVEPGPGWARKDWPTLLICAAANISDDGATPPGRGVTSFTFSPTEIGGPLVGGVSTSEFEGSLSESRRREYTLATAIAISGAALSPSMGKLTRRPFRFLLALGNVRLGVWVPNPRRVEDFKRRKAITVGLARAATTCKRRLGRRRGGATAPADGYEEAKWRAPRPGPPYLLRELFGLNSVDQRHLYVSDGGHYENLGLVELLRRGCTDIICFDASGGKTFGTLGDAVALARSELEVDIEIDTEDLTEDDGIARAPVVAGTIRYNDADNDADKTRGRLLYARTVLTKDAPFDAHAFHQKDSRFPHHSTVDQLFTDEKFEAYRVLGDHAARAALKLRAADDAPPTDWQALIRALVAG